MSKKRIISLILSILLLSSLVFPIGVFAEEEIYVETAQEYNDTEIEVTEEDVYGTEDLEIYEDISTYEDDTYEELEVYEVEDIDASESVDESSFAEATDFDNIVFAADVLTIDMQPEDWTGPETGYATYSVTVKGGTAPYQYQWQYNKGTGKWIDRGDATEATFSILAKGRDGFQWRCVVTDSTGATATSDPATLTIGAGFEIDVQPKDWTGPETGYATYSVTVKGGTAPYQYQWQYNKGTGKWFDRGGATEATFSILAKGRDGFQWHCVVTDSTGATVTSDPATLTIKVDTFVENEVTYKLNSDSTVKIISYAGNATSLEIPSTVNNYTVNAVGEEAFMNNTTLVSVSLPNTIEVIGARAFKGCTNLSTMTSHD